MIRPEILDRFVCAKYLFYLGSEALDRSGPFSAGQAVLTFQDAVEMMLRTIAEHHHAPIKEHAAFNSIVDEVEKATGQTLTHKTALNQLNRSRVNFKHHALAPRDEDVRKFRTDLEGFFPTVMKATMGLDFDQLSMATLVRHRRAANWLRNAETHLAHDEFEKSMEASAVAFAVFRSRQQDGHSRSSLESVLRNAEPRGRSDERIHRGVYDLAERLEKMIGELHLQIEDLSSGIDRHELHRFTDLVPKVFLSEAGTLHIGSRRRSDLHTYENALFCVAFATRTLLKLQDRYQPSPGFAPDSVYRVVQKGSMVVRPGKEPIEEIREVESGEELLGWYRNSGFQGFVAVLQDGDCAYVSETCLEKIEPA